MKCLSEIVSSEDKEIMLDFIAYCLWREYKFANWLLFNGSGQNGKTTLLNMIIRFLGKI
jgi:phage/plasmid-associated DNA primase